VGFTISVMLGTVLFVKHTFSVLCTHVLSKRFHDFAEFLPLLLLFGLITVLHSVAEFRLHLLALLFSTHLVHKVFHHAHETTACTTWSTATTSSTSFPATFTTF
jgi:hypothetical protein